MRHVFTTIFLALSLFGCSGSNVSETSLPGIRAAAGATLRVLSAVQSTSGSEQELSSNSGTWDLGTLWMGKTTDLTLTVKNAGDMVAHSVTATSTATTGFEVTSNTCGSQLAVGATCAIGVQFHPEERGSMSSDISLTYRNDGPFTQTQTLSQTIEGTSQAGAIGALDSETFGSGGIVRYKPDPGSDTLRWSALQTDGKIVSVGSVWTTGLYYHGIVRFNEDGSLDSTFGSSGLTRLQFSTGVSESSRSVVVTDDGKIVGVGSSRYAGIDRGIIYRLNADGSLDTTFATAGHYELTNGVYEEFRSVVLMSNGDIIAYGMTGGDQVLVRLNSSGVPVSTFGTSGVKTISLSGTVAETGSQIIVGADGNLYSAGYLSNGTNTDFFAEAIDPSTGNLISSFGTGGSTIVDFSGNDAGYGIAQQPDGKLVLSGSTTIAGVSRIAAIRLTSSGALDATFATNGKYYYSNATPNGWANGITVDNNGRIYVGGAIGTDGSGTNRVVLLRLTSSGVADTTWNGGNEVSSQYINQFGGVGHRQRTSQILLQADGKILMTGYYHDGANEAMGLMRFWP